jgi:tripartite-type tricarboxylate transporter receptor subunit TctC
MVNSARVLMLLAACGAATVSAQTYPAKAVRMIVSYPAGGPNDIMGRTISAKLTELMGQTFVVDNRSGAAGNIGTDSVAKAAPDGYTLLMGAGAMTIAPSLYPKLPYDVVRDFAPVSMVASAGFVLVLHPSVPAKTVAQFIDLLKKQPGKLNCASSGVGAPPHLALELFQSMTGTKMNHIPYKGATPALTDLVGGQVDLYFAGISGAIPHIQSGRLRTLAVTGKKRSVVLPEVPTLDQSGLKGYDVATWFGVLAPAGTPRDIINRLNAATVKAVSLPDTREKLLAAGAEPDSSTPEEFAKHIREEIVKFREIVRTSGAKLD